MQKTLDCETVVEFLAQYKDNDYVEGWAKLWGKGDDWADWI
jgi:hypothetical protein